MHHGHVITSNHTVKNVFRLEACDIIKPSWPPPSSSSSSYPEPGGLDAVQPQAGVIDPGELGDGGGAVTQHEAEAHGAENGRQRRQVQLPVLHFTAARKRNRGGGRQRKVKVKGQRVTCNQRATTSIRCVSAFDG